jgi:hypothetical protein
MLSRTHWRDDYQPFKISTKFIRSDCGQICAGGAPKYSFLQPPEDPGNFGDFVDSFLSLGGSLQDLPKTRDSKKRKGEPLRTISGEG